jgi:XTP/dITP diphosphohydrolase
MHKMLIATANPGKVKEIRSILGNLPVQLIPASQLPQPPVVEEIHPTYAENSLLKALEYAKTSRMPSLADDTGLEVECLGGAPGVFSHRYSVLPGAGDADRRQLLLQNLAPHPRPWKALFICVASLALPDGQYWNAEGECRGEIIPEERGTNGFGYDAIFRMDGMNKTMAELTMNEKNRFGHRARAVLLLVPEIIRLFDLKTG